MNVEARQARHGKDSRGTAGIGPAEHGTAGIMRQLFDLPDEMARLPRDHRGYPVPRFVAWIDGKPEFRAADPVFWSRAVKEKLCWLCGGGMSRRQFFVLGPMCSITRTTTEPPCHRGCAIFAVKNCPFLTKPMAVRNERNMPEDTRHPGGEMIARNPGVTALWESASYEIFRDPAGNPLIRVGYPVSLSFWREGRKATMQEAMDSIESGLPILYDVAAREGQQSVLELEVIVTDYMRTTFRRFA